MNELIATIEVQAEIIAKLRMEKAQMAQELSKLKASSQATHPDEKATHQT